MRPCVLYCRNLVCVLPSCTQFKDGVFYLYGTFTVVVLLFMDVRLTPLGKRKKKVLKMNI